MNKTALLSRGNQIVQVYRDREFFALLFSIAVPIILQNFFTSSLNLVSVMMIGQMGETSVAAVGLANQIFFLLQLLLFGLNSGSAIFNAQFWGKRDVVSIQKVLGLSLLLGLLGSMAFTGIAIFLPQAVLGVYSTDPAVISLGSAYLALFGLSFPFTAITFSYSATLRSTGNVKTPLVVSLTTLGLNILLSYGLIFGKAGLPAMGITGAALAILISRILEAGAIVWITYLQKAPAAAHIREWLSIDRRFAAKVLRRILPVTANEILWSLGITTYNIVYARIGTEAIASMNIAVTIDNLAQVSFIGIAHACAILVGNLIGAGNERKAYHYAGITLSLGIGGAVLVGAVILLGAGNILTFYKVSSTVIDYTRNILAVIAFVLWLRVMNLILFIGILRSGGDTRFAFFLDCGAIWIIGVPLALVGAFVFHLPIYQVYLLVMIEELVKCILALSRFFSKNWIHNVTHALS